MGRRSALVPATAIPAPSSPIASARDEPVVPVTASGTGSSGRAPAGRADGTGSAAGGSPCTAPQDQSRAHSPPASQCPFGQTSLHQPHTSASVPASTTPHPLSFLCCCHADDELPNFGLSALSQSQSQSRGCTPNPSPSSAIRAPALSGVCSQLGRLTQVQNLVHTPGVLHSWFVTPLLCYGSPLVGLFDT